jgi:hypothetical protein
MLCTVIGVVMTLNFEQVYRNVAVELQRLPWEEQVAIVSGLLVFLHQLNATPRREFEFILEHIRVQFLALSKSR